MKKILLFTILAACNNAQTQQTKAECQLTPGDYPVQTATYQGDQGQYELMLLNAPACFQQPLKLKGLQLARIDAKATERVKLTYNGEENSVLHMAEDFQIKMVQTVTENGVSKEQSGSWSPFLAGAAGAVVGAAAMGMIGRAFNKPQYYTPPPMQAGRTDLRGYGGVGDTREGAARSYQQKYASRPMGSPQVAPSPAPTETKKSFFKTRSESQPSQGAARSYQSAPSSSGKRGFFKSRRR